MATHSSILAWKVDRGAWWATVHGVTKSRTTEHTSFMSKQRTLRPSTLGPSSRPECAPREESGWRKAGPWPQVGEGHVRRRNFSEPRLLHLPIHRKALNSLP